MEVIRVSKKIVLSPELLTLFERIKGEGGRESSLNFNTAYLAYFVVNHNSIIKKVFEDAGIRIEKIKGIISKERFNEPSDMLIKVIRRGAVKALRNNKQVISPIHLFMGILEEKESAGYKLIENVQLDPEKLLSYLWKLTISGVNKSNIRLKLKQEKPKVKEQAENGERIKKGEALSNKNRVLSTNPKIPPEVVDSFVQLSLYNELKELNEKKLKDLSVKPSMEKLLIKELSISLTELARENKIDPIIGREKEIEKVIDVLHKRKSNNPILLGSPGVGKTAIVEGVARYFVTHNIPIEVLKLDLGKLLHGTAYRGSLASKLSKIQEEVKNANGRIIVFIDEIHRLLEIDGEGGDLAQSFKEALAKGEFPCIGATTEEEFKKYIESDGALLRRFTKIYVEEPDLKTTIDIVKGTIQKYEEFHKVKYSDEIIEYTIRLLSRYVYSKSFPDKAFEAIDLAGAKTSRIGKKEVTKEIVAEVVSLLSGIPVERIMESDGDRLLRIEEFLNHHIVGQKEVIEKIGHTLRRNVVMYRGQNRPLSSFLFLGPTGVGKTETAKLLAELLFPGKNGITILNMSEFSEQHTVSRLIGAPPGYIGFDKGGELTEKVRLNPYQIVLFDEIEKAHSSIWMLLLQILDEGRLTDGRGRDVSFSNCVIILTSNLGTETLRYKKEPTGFKREPLSQGITDEECEVILEEAKTLIPEELWARIDAKLNFKPLTKEHLLEIAERHLCNLKTTLLLNYQLEVEFGGDVAKFIVDKCDIRYGAREVKTKIGEILESKLAEFILQNNIKGGKITIGIDNNKINFS